MGQRRIRQASLAEALLPAGAGSNRRLERIAGLIDRASLGRLLAPLRAPTGLPGYPPLAEASIVDGIMHRGHARRPPHSAG